MTFEKMIDIIRDTDSLTSEFNAVIMELEDAWNGIMPFDKLKAEAKRQGYNLIPITKVEKLLPCICGCNRRKHWYCSTGEWLKCEKCGREGYIGKSHAEAIHKWNEMIKELSNDK